MVDEELKLGLKARHQTCVSNKVPLLCVLIFASKSLLISEDPQQAENCQYTTNTMLTMTEMLYCLLQGFLHLASSSSSTAAIVRKVVISLNLLFNMICLIIASVFAYYVTQLYRNPDPSPAVNNMRLELSSSIKSVLF